MTRPEQLEHIEAALSALSTDPLGQLTRWEWMDFSPAGCIRCAAITYLRIRHGWTAAEIGKYFKVPHWQMYYVLTEAARRSRTEFAMAVYRQLTRFEMAMPMRRAA